MQGSVIAPILFLIMINDINNKLVNVNTLLYADDTTIYKAGSNIEKLLSHLQEALDGIQQWSEAWGFKISATKSNAIVFSKSHVNIENKLKLRSAYLPVVSEVKYLGVIFDSKLTYIPYINYL